MNYEKAYKEALERAREFQKSKDGLCVLTAESIFPELQESEDEKIRKRIFNYINVTLDDNESAEKEKWLAWLEKQKSVGEIVKRYKNSWYNEGKIAGQFEGITDDEKYQQGWHDALEKQGEQKPTDNVEPKFKVGDVMRTLQEADDGIVDGMPVVISIDKEYYHCTNELIAIKDQDDYEFPPINVKQKSTWSEEDEEILKNLIDYFSLDDGLRLPTEETIDWLKSLKERLS